MPIYEYRCAGCQHQFDVIQKMNDEPITTCPQCAEDKVDRLISAAGFQLKGSGWYATDFKTKPKQTGDNKSVETSSSETISSADKTSTSSGSTEK
jgi:putative FmdB family regulatory protein